MKPVFIFSLPRSGSTLLQRILATNDEIATVSEPWLLLPSIYALRNEGVYAEYGHYHLSTAVNEFCDSLPHGKDDYYEAVHNMALELYEKAVGGDVTYFLDKTPRYHLICEEIIRMFPEAKFIFLWRNPLAIIASMIESSGSGKKNWNLYHYKVDLFDGIRNLVSARRPLGDRVIDVSYESLILHSENEWQRVFDYLCLDYDIKQLQNFSSVKMQGTMGDPTGVAMYRDLSTEPLEKWKTVIGNPVRKAWCIRFLKKIGEDSLREMGYEQNELIAELRSIPNTSQHLISDAFYMAYGAAFCALEPYILKRKLGALMRWDRVHAHT